MPPTRDDEDLPEPGRTAVPHPAIRVADARSHLLTGQVVAERFVIEALVGVGGMGKVYRARDLESALPVALKVLSKSEANGGERFALEALALAELSHPRIVRYVAHGLVAPELPFLAMDWLDGEDLSVRLSRGGLEVAESIAVARGICEGLAFAHAKGIIHRDIKPSNIFLVERAATGATLLDFGVARLASAPRTLTRAGAMLGTVGYMAPEQAMGLRDVDARADVFALGCVLLECLTGRPAFAASHDVAVLAKVLRDDPPRVGALRPELGSEVDAVLARMLAKERAQRPPDAASVLRMLDSLVGLTGDAPGPSAALASEPFDSSEQRMLSVILGRPSAAPSAPASERAAHTLDLERIARSHGADLTWLPSGAVLLVMSGLRATTAADQAVQAARCALSLRGLCPELTFGVATGGVNTSSDVPVGDAIDRAASLVSDSDAAGVIKLDPLTAGLLGHRFEVASAPEGPVLVGEREDAEELSVLMGRATPFVGRAKELGLLEATLEECISDDVARAVLVTAPPGAGKSRLGREFAERVRKTEVARLVVARADPTSAGSSLNLVKRLVRTAAGMREGISHLPQRTQLEHYLAPMVAPERLPELLEFLCELVGLRLDAPPSPRLRAARNDPEVMREQKRRAFVAWVDAESARQPLVLMLEDLHWGDLPSVCYLQEVLRLFARRPLFILALARPEVHEHFPRLHEASVLDEVRLKGLTSRASEQLVRAILPPSVDDAVVRRVVGLADGNAFYLEELVRRVAQGGTELPDTVLAMAQSRIDQLAPEARRVLRAASVFGGTAWTGGIGALVGAADTTMLCNSLAEQEILVRRANSRFPGEREFGFRHAFLREAAYALLSGADRVTGHRKAAEWLEVHGERDARVLADHFERGGVGERAASWLLLAARATLDGSDFEGTIALTQRGMRLQASPADRGMLLLLHAYASIWCVRAETGLLTEALDLLPRAGAEWWLAAALQVYSASMLGQAELATPYLELALTSAPGLELTGVYGQALHTLATGAALIGRADVGWRILHQFECFMESRHNPKRDQVFVAWFDATRCVLASNSAPGGSWRLDDALRWGRDGLAEMQAAGSAFGEASAMFHLANVHALLGSYEEAESWFRTSLSLAAKTRNLLVRQHAELGLAVMALRSGAAAEAQRALTELAQSSNLNVACGAACILADLKLRQGKLEEAAVDARRIAVGPALMYRRMASCLLGRALLRQQRAEDAVAVVTPLASERDDVAFPQFEVDLLCTRAEGLLRLGATHAATETVARACRFRARAAAPLADPRTRANFLTLGQSNHRLDELARVLSISCPTPNPKPS